MAVGDELGKTFSADASVNAATIQTRQTGSPAADAQAAMQFMTEKKKLRVSLHRSALTSADAADIATHSGISLVDVGNSPNVGVDCLFSITGAQADVFLARYDSAGNLLGISEIATILADGTYTNGTKYVAPRLVVDVAGAAQVAAILKTAPASGNVDIRIVPL